MLGTILSIAGGVSQAINIYKFVSTLAKGSDAELVLGALDRIHAQVERLNDNILYAPAIEGLSTGGARRLGDLHQARALLEPVQVALGGEIVSSGLIETPHKMERAMIENPWAVLEDIRPQHLAVHPGNFEKVPVLFVHQNVRYIGWQMRGALPVLFNCELHDLPGLGASRVRVAVPPVSADSNPAPRVQPSSGETAGKLIVRRPFRLGGVAVVHRLLADGKEIGRISFNKTGEFMLLPGHYKIEVEQWGMLRSDPLELEIAAGSRTFVEIGVVILKNKLRLVRV
jgi:hypothetical protein